jgi:hypothetical protein
MVDQWTRKDSHWSNATFTDSVFVLEFPPKSFLLKMASITLESGEEQNQQGAQQEFAN